ncbi:MAG: methyltransferase domain-containing protein [Nitrospirae bacterium]|nr:methyltransferase domain-containing protein [Nitrospirota bacterium]
MNRTGVKPEEAEHYYNETYVETHSYSAGEALSARQHFESRLDTVRPIADFIRPYLRGDFRVFELGAATGELLYLLKNEVSYGYVNDVMYSYIEFAKKELGLDGSSDDYFRLSFAEKFDMVISVNTIDHMYFSDRAVRKVYEDLKPGGYFYVEVPNDDQALNRFLPPETLTAFRKFMYQKAHYYSFSFETLSRLLQETGFDVEFASSRHDYTLRNYLQWYFLGKPQKKLNEAMLDTDLHDGQTDFEFRMNALFARADSEFKSIMSDTKAGELLCIMARKP